MKNFFNKYFRNNIMNKIFLSYAVSAILCACIFYNLLPQMLNYAPMFSYIDELSGISYKMQYYIMVSVALLTGYFVILFCLKGVNEIEEYLKNPQDQMPEQLRVKTQKLFYLPYRIYAASIIVPVIVVMLLILPMYIIEEASLFVFLRLFIMIISFFVLISIITLVITQREFKKLMFKAESYNEIDGMRIPMAGKLYIEIFSMFIIALLFSSLIGYSNNIRDKGDLISDSYTAGLKDKFKEQENLSRDKIKLLLYEIRTVQDTGDVRFLIDPEKNIETSDGKELEGYFLTYLYELSYKNGGFVYDVTEETRGVITTVEGENGTYTVGIKFRVASSNMVISYLINIIIVILLCALVLYFLSKAMSEDILSVAASLSDIASGEYESLNKKLPVTSNDEISDLIISFNKIQYLVQDYISQIQRNQEVLIQNDRLVSLGQLMGGIAHSLKTPISTASDSVICIENLANEYDESIDNEIVTKEDHHNIASEIKGHIADLKDTFDYINSIINSVKNYTTDLNNGNKEKFPVKELMSSVNILMSNELKKNSCRLNINTNMKDDELIDGDIKSLIQIIDVLISNAILAYPQGNGQIDFSILKDENKIQIIVKDYGVGIPKSIQIKLFNKMVTTRGNKGTGIGLYISNSIIKAKFKGSLSFESEEGRGAKFRIVLPVKKEESYEN